VDVTDEAQVKALVHEVVRRNGRIDILVNSAGVMADALPITELAADIRVNCVCPGSIDTPMLRRKENADIEIALIETASAAGRVGLPEEVAALIHFLTTDDCRYINGQVIVIDGGLVGLHSNALVGTIVGAIETLGLARGGMHRGRAARGRNRVAARSAGCCSNGGAPTGVGNRSVFCQPRFGGGSARPGPDHRSG
jgi:hypothetical protein